MKRLTKIVAVATIAALSIGTVSAFSAEKFQGFKGMKFPFQSEERTQEKQFKNRPQRVELTEEEKAAKIEEVKADLAKKLEEGKLTQEQYDQMLANIEEGKFFGFGGRFGKGHGRNFEKGEMPQRPERVELTEEEKAAKKEEMKARWAQKLEEGKITQEQYDQMLANIEEGKFFGFGGKFGKGHGRNFEKGERAERAELTEEEKAAKVEEMKAHWAKKLQEGKISQEQYDKKIAQIEEGKFGFDKNFKKGPAKNFNKGKKAERPKKTEKTEE